MAHFHRCFVMSNRQTSHLQTSYHICPILSNLISHCKVWALYMQNLGLSSPCMHDFAHKKSPKTREKFANIVMLFYKTNMKFIGNQDKRFVILQGCFVLLYPPLFSGESSRLLYYSSMCRHLAGIRRDTEQNQMALDKERWLSRLSRSLQRR